MTAGWKRLMLGLKLTLIHVLLFLCIWIGGASYLFLPNFQVVPQQSGIIFYSLASLKFVNSALISNPRIDSKIIILRTILMQLWKLRSNSKLIRLLIIIRDRLVFRLLIVIWLPVIIIRLLLVTRLLIIIWLLTIIRLLIAIRDRVVIQLVIVIRLLLIIRFRIVIRLLIIIRHRSFDPGNEGHNYLGNEWP